MKLLALLLSVASLSFAEASSTSPPTAAVKNGTYVGEYIGGSWDQDAFLGIPFAQPPVGSLRFKRPASLNTTFESKNATSYGYSCWQASTIFNMSEDCLTLNVVRPAGTTTKSKLAVLVWIYGGGFTSGSSADPQYNLSGVVRLAQDINEPIIVASINYRVGLWGFLNSPETFLENSTNAGLYDQRLALHWIQENIAAFGGDPDKVTIWAESAGAQSIGMQTHAFGGRNDHIFRAAIMESGSAIGTPMQALPFYAVPYANLTGSLNCSTATSPLACLRDVPINALVSSALNDVGGAVWNAVVDGEFFLAWPSQSMAQPDSHTPVPLLIGTNSDEGTSFPIAEGINTTHEFIEAFYSYRTYSISPASIAKMLELYPEEPAHIKGETYLPYPPVHLPEGASYPALYGAHWRRAGAIGGDITMHSGRRKTCIEYTQKHQKSPQTVYSYRFDTPPYNETTTYTTESPGGNLFNGAQHFVNVQYSFQNISGAMGPLPAYQKHIELSRAIGRAYIGFVVAGDPNAFRTKTLPGEGGVLPVWTTYNENPSNMVLNSNGSWVEDDTWRAAGMAYINSIDREFTV